MPVTCTAMVRTHDGGYIFTFSDGMECFYADAEALRCACAGLSAKTPELHSKLLKRWADLDPTLSFSAPLLSLT